MADIITGNRYFIEDAEGNKHRIYPAKINEIAEVNDLLLQVNFDFILVNYLNQKYEDDMTVARDANGKLLYDDTQSKALMKIWKKATKQTEKQILSWIDVSTARELIELYTDASHLKKENVMMTKEM
jgi:hypothetical protein